MHYPAFLFEGSTYSCTHSVLFRQGHLWENSHIFSIPNLMKQSTLVSILSSSVFLLISSRVSLMFPILYLALLALEEESDRDSLGRTIVVFMLFLVKPVESSLFLRLLKSPKDWEYLVSTMKERSDNCIILLTQSLLKLLSFNPFIFTNIQTKKINEIFIYAKIKSQIKLKISKIQYHKAP